MSKNKSAVIATVIIALAALVVAFFAFYKMAEDKQIESDFNEQQYSVYTPSDELGEEMTDAAEALLKENYTVLKLYYTKGLGHLDEPYGNLPEDGIYTVSDTTYTDILQLEAIVDAAFMPDAAAKIKTNPQGKGAVYVNEENGDLGISSDFVPLDYSLSWENPSFKIFPQSDIKVTLEVVVHEKDGTEKLLQGSMMKANGVWLLEDIIY